MYQKCILQYYILHTRSYAHRKCNRFEIDVLLEQIELGNLFLEFFGHLQSKLSLWILPKKRSQYNSAARKKTHQGSIRKGIFYYGRWYCCSTVGILLHANLIVPF